MSQQYFARCHSSLRMLCLPKPPIHGSLSPSHPLDIDEQHVHGLVEIGFRRTAHVRREDHVGELEEGVTGGEGLGVGDAVARGEGEERRGREGRKSATDGRARVRENVLETRSANSESSDSVFGLSLRWLRLQSLNELVLIRRRSSSDVDVDLQFGG